MKGIECLVVDVRVDPAKPNEQGLLVEIAEPIPFSRHPHRIERELILGRDGLVRVRLDGEIVCDHQGPVGYGDQSHACWSFGLYGSRWCPGGEEIAAHFENWREGLAA